MTVKSFNVSVRFENSFPLALQIMVSNSYTFILDFSHNIGVVVGSTLN
jgi:hypothetical protein